jgi:hypothetical protein
MKICALTIGLLLIASFALAADIDGKWIGQIAGMGGGDPMTLTYTFKANGADLTGTSLGPDGKEIPIKNGKINGNNISFQVVIDMGGNEMKFDYKGVLSGDQLKLSFDMGMGGPPQEFTLKKAK